MKCIRNKQTQNIIRVDDKQAYQMVGNTWEYVSKDIWRQSQGVVKTESSNETTVIKKNKKEKKSKKVEN